MEDDGTSYLALYSKSGEQLAEGAIHVENGGTPLAIALSADGQNWQFPVWIFMMEA